MNRPRIFSYPLVAVAVAAAVAATGCAVGSRPAGVDACEEAALHRETCTGEYITPPVCDDGAKLQAKELLAASCDEIAARQSAGGKGDGAFCDWFGVGCTSDSSIFRGPQCETDRDCSGDRTCAEGHCFEGVGSPEFADAFDRNTGSTEVAGDAVRLLVDNDTTRELREAMVDRAEHSIHFTTLSVLGGRVSRDMVAQFAEAEERGVEVRVVVDAVAQDRFAGYELLEDMADAGVDVLAFNPIGGWATLRLGLGLNLNNRLHEKMLIVDGEEAIVGGRNTGGAFLHSGRAFDLDVHVEGPGVAEIQRMFLELWDKNAAWEREAGCPGESERGFHCPASGRSLQDDPSYYPEQSAAGTARTRTIYSEPYTEDPSDGYFTYNSLVRGARESITIAAGYFVPPRRLRNHLREAAERGVEVRVLKNSLRSTWYDYIYWASLNFYRELIGAGVDIREYQGRSMMHAKAMVVDGEVAVVGSFNLSPRSAESNSEALILIRESEAIARLQDTLDDALADATPASADLTWRQRLKASAHRTVEWLF